MTDTFVEPKIVRVIKGQAVFNFDSEFDRVVSVRRIFVPNEAVGVCSVGLLSISSGSNYFLDSFQAYQDYYLPDPAQPAELVLSTTIDNIGSLANVTLLLRGTTDPTFTATIEIKLNGVVVDTINYDATYLASITDPGWDTGVTKISLAAQAGQSGTLEVRAVVPVQSSTDYFDMRAAASCCECRIIAGTGNIGSNGDGGLATAADINSPYGVAVHPATGDIYFSESNAHKIRKIDATTGIITTICGTGVAGFSGDGGLATAAKVSEPLDLTFDLDQNLVFIDNDNFRIRKIDLTTGIITTIAGSGGFTYNGPGLDALATNVRASGIIYDAAGNLYIASTVYKRISVLDPTTNLINHFAGTGANFTGTENVAAATNPIGQVAQLALDADENLYCGAGPNNYLVKIEQATGLIKNVMGDGTFNYPTDGATALGAPAIAGQGLVIDTTNNILYSYKPGIVGKINLTTGIFNYFIGSQTDNTEGNNVDAVAPNAMPLGDGNGQLALDADGHLIIAEGDKFFYGSYVKQIFCE